MYTVKIERPDQTQTFGTQWAELTHAQDKAWRTFQQLNRYLCFGFAVVILEDGREYARYEVQ